MIIRCDNCSVSLQLDEAKIPAQHFTVRCPRCQNMIRIQNGANGQSPSVKHLEANKPAPPVGAGATDFSVKESEFQINQAIRTLLAALQTEKRVLDSDDSVDEKPRRVLLCLGQKAESVGKVLSEAGYKVYLAQTPAQANERLREGKTRVLIFSPDFAAELGGAAILQQKINAMPPAERRRLFLISLEEKGMTMNAHEAFLRNLNLVVNVSDIPQLPLILNRTLRDFNELYHYYHRAIGEEPI